MITISIIGSGNAAQHLILAFEKSSEVQLIQVFSRDKNKVKALVDSQKIINDYDDLQKVDLIIIAVSDHAIVEVSSKIPFQNQLVAHTSGAVSLNDLDAKNRKSVFYPLQTFSKNKEINFFEIPICLEAQNESDFEILKKIAQTISHKTYKINSEQRKSLHVSAVFVCNFVNHLYQIGNEICTENNVDFEILKPLILETANKIKTLSPKEAQTGPAKRQDSQTINSHLAFLSDENQKEIYKILTKSIIDDGKKL
jgi:predicted short-subunit dehydrogenase-like oxidoreductase (DUF2520 family)